MRYALGSLNALRNETKADFYGVSDFNDIQQGIGNGFVE
jgi:hypothetical protein